MKIIVTGATGFVGKHFVQELLDRCHEVVAVSRSRQRFEKCDWRGEVRFISADLHQAIENPRSLLGDADVVAHFAWPGLPNFKSMFHVEENLPAAYQFLKSLVDAGYTRLLVAGTCFEYGDRCGPLSEDLPAEPTTAYGVAKDSLRRFLVSLQSSSTFQLQWARLFYLFGEGQSAASLIPQLNAAIDRGDPVFNMSGGEQLRDFLPIGSVAKKLVDVLESPDFEGVVNICRGEPTSVRRLVEQRIAERNASIRLNLGHYPYPEYEPFAFWGDNRKLQLLEKAAFQ